MKQKRKKQEKKEGKLRESNKPKKREEGIGGFAKFAFFQ